MEEERLSGQPTMSISEARIARDKRIDILRLKRLEKVTSTVNIVYNCYMN